MSKFTTFIETANRAIYKTKFRIGKHAPEILLVVGAVSIVAGTVVACKSSMKLQDVIDETHDTVEKIEAAKNGIVKLKENEKYTEEDAANDMHILQIQTAWKVVKMYAPAAGLITGGLSCIVGSHIIMRNRNAAALAAFNTVTTAFAAYRNRVADRFGADVQKEIEDGIKIEKRETGETNEDGTPKTEDVAIKVDDLNATTYSVRFGEDTSPFYQTSREYNIMRIKQTEREANRLLKLKGFMFLNDIYKMLDMKPTKVGQLVGWMYNPDDESIPSYISIDYTSWKEMDASDPRMMELEAEGNNKFYDLWLSFTPDGCIIDKI